MVELGPGAGAFTSAVQERIGGRGRHVAIELHEQWAMLPAVLAERDIPPASVGAVVSGLPWVAYARGLHALITDALAPTGVFTQFAYSWTRWAPPARRQLADLRRHFGDVVTSPVVWRNLPPAVVHEARRPLTGAPGGVIHPPPR